MLFFKYWLHLEPACLGRVRSHSVPHRMSVSPWERPGLTGDVWKKELDRCGYKRNSHLRLGQQLHVAGPAGVSLGL